MSMHHDVVDILPRGEVEPTLLVYRCTPGCATRDGVHTTALESTARMSREGNGGKAQHGCSVAAHVVMETTMAGTSTKKSTSRTRRSGTRATNDSSKTRTASKKKYGDAASRSVERALHKEKRGTLKSGSGDTVTSRKQAIAIGLSEAREKGAKVPKK